MARFSVQLLKTAVVSSAPNTLGEIVGSTSARVRITEFTLGFSSNPADIQVRWDVQRGSAVGAGGTAFTPVPLDAADAAASTTATSAPTTEPTYTAAAVLWSTGQNQRATVRWFAPPDGEMIIPATAAARLGWRTPVVNGGSPDGAASIIFNE